MRRVVALLAVLAILLRRTLLVVRVKGHSMEPTLPSGTCLLVRRVGVRGVRRGRIVLVRPSATQLARLPAPDASVRRLVKRVAAVAGDPVPAGVAAVAGVDGPVRRVPAGQVVLLGDNPARSLDSRHLGFFDAASVLGVALRVLDGS